MQLLSTVFPMTLESGIRLAKRFSSVGSIRMSLNYHYCILAFIFPIIAGKRMSGKCFSLINITANLADVYLIVIHENHIWVATIIASSLTGSDVKSGVVVFKSAEVANYNSIGFINCNIQLSVYIYIYIL